MKGGGIVGITEKYNEEYQYVEYAVEKYSDLLFRICCSILMNQADAEDAVQETFMRYMTKAPLFRDSDHEKAWLIKVATNICKNMVRFKMRHDFVNLEELKNIGVNNDDRDILETIMRLPPKYKIVLDLYYIEGYKANEISSIINVSPAAVRKRLQYGRKLLKHEFERNELHES
ncbi:MAG: sigma-70 family RNA polymerase sigma factor [Clostridia bacterium]|nr:sigma-70 family RNA polymerase sigma factor [Clostridia bacterium]MBR6619344.1 sigma-70 family RNA polymerase sigma factor [Clostridia bacterium]